MSNINIDKLCNLVKTYYVHDISSDDLCKEINNNIDIFKTHLTHFKATDTNYTFSQLDNPFFFVPKTDIINTCNEINNCDYNDIMYDNISNAINKSNKSIVFNPYFIMLYLTVKSETKAFSIGNWTLFSLNQIIDDFNTLLLEEPEITWCTLGHKYMGLGYYKALRMDITNGKLFTQLDGGSNDWDRLAYWEQYKNQKIKESDFIEYSNLITLLISGNE